ncbi:IS3 family transposase [Prescottella equi]|uniref:IS3 family transposase n=1 Tax=Rhodococcus hoagii TaxID=43767 RepID=UPI00301DC017
MKVDAVVSLKAEHRLDVLLDVAWLARSTFFYHQAHLQAPDPRAELKPTITDAFEGSDGRYGHRRIHCVLARAGWRVAMKTVLALMRTIGGSAGSAARAPTSPTRVGSGKLRRSSTDSFRPYEHSASSLQTGDVWQGSRQTNPLVETESRDVSPNTTRR